MISTNKLNIDSFAVLSFYIHLNCLTTIVYYVLQSAVLLFTGRFFAISAQFLTILSPRSIDPCEILYR